MQLHDNILVNPWCRAYIGPKNPDWLSQIWTITRMHKPKSSTHTYFTIDLELDEQNQLILQLFHVCPTCGVHQTGTSSASLPLLVYSSSSSLPCCALTFHYSLHAEVKKYTATATIINNLCQWFMYIMSCFIKKKTCQFLYGQANLRLGHSSAVSDSIAFKNSWITTLHQKMLSMAQRHSM